MKNWIRSIIAASLLAAIYFFPGCNKVKFNNEPSKSDPCFGLAQGCTASDGVSTFDYQMTTSDLRANLLFVVDSSASMSPLQANMGSRFPSLFGYLSNINYQIGIVTMDLTSSSPSAGGQLLSFPDGSQLLTPRSSNPTWQFQNTIQRSETLRCDDWIRRNCDLNVGCQDPSAYAANCPSEDTRGIKAAGLVISTDSTGLVSPGVPLTVVILSNADERASGGRYPGPGLEPEDFPSDLLQKARNKIGLPQSLIAHSIIIRPGDVGCYNSQRQSNSVFGWYGNYYSQLSSATPGGQVGTVCANDYSGQLGAIGTNAAQTASLVLPCPPLNNAAFNVSLTPDAGFTALPPDGVSSTIRFPQAVPPNTTIRVHYQCTSSAS